MEKRALMVATVPSMIGQFNMNNIHILHDLGYKVDVAADFTDTSIWPTERIKKFKNELERLHIDCIQLDFSRNPLKLKRHYQSYKETIALINERKYELIHTHTPIASAIVRMAAKNTGARTIYTAHGFHFYHGASLKNWVIFYPVEKKLSRYTDVLVTITEEDYQRAYKKFRAKKTAYVPGVGIDTEKYTTGKEGRNRIRNELGIREDQFLLLSVGELNENKNHQAVIRGVRELNLVYVIVGKGDLKEELESVAEECGTDLRLTGFRTDVADFYQAADAYILPSIREGLNVSLMEAMASGLPCLCGKIRGNVDLIDEQGGILFNPRSEEEIRIAVKSIMTADRNAMGNHNRDKSKKYSVNVVNALMKQIYEGNV